MKHKSDSLHDLKKLAKKMEWTYQHIAEHLDVSVGSVANWMQGRFQPSALAEFKIEQFLKDEGV